jgi:RNA polymerase sigma-70 factor (ECF subfamily)
VLEDEAGSNAGPHAGDQRATFDATARVYEEHFDYVWRSLRRLGVPPAAVDDAVQEVFLVVHRRIPEFDGRASIKTWLFAIALRVAPKHRRRFHPSDGVVDVEPASTAAAPDEALASARAAQTLYAILSELEETRRETFVMAELEELPAKDIAELTGTPVNTVYSRLRLARRDFNAAVARRLRRER